MPAERTMPAFQCTQECWTPCQEGTGEHQLTVPVSSQKKVPPAPSWCWCHPWEGLFRGQRQDLQRLLHVTADAWCMHFAQAIRKTLMGTVLHTPKEIIIPTTVTITYRVSRSRLTEMVHSVNYHLLMPTRDSCCFIIIQLTYNLPPAPLLFVKYFKFLLSSIAREFYKWY